MTSPLQDNVLFDICVDLVHARLKDTSFVLLEYVTQAFSNIFYEYVTEVLLYSVI